MQKNDYALWLKEWFNAKLNMPYHAVCNNFFSEGWLNSLKTLELILDIEKTLHIPLNDTLFNDPRFYNIEGLAEILFEQQQIKAVTI